MPLAKLTMRPLIMLPSLRRTVSANTVPDITITNRAEQSVLKCVGLLNIVPPINKADEAGVWGRPAASAIGIGSKKTDASTNRYRCKILLTLGLQPPIIQRIFFAARRISRLLCKSDSAASFLLGGVELSCMGKGYEITEPDR